MKKTGQKSIQKWKSFDFGADNPGPATTAKTTFNFSATLEPQSVSDLAVHSKKVKEVETWLQLNVLSKPSKKGTPMLLITGPTGCGKTTTLNIVCKSFKVQVSEWVNPIDREFDFGRVSGQTARFAEFLYQAKYPSLFDDFEKKITLVEDFPNSVIHNPSEFHSVLEKCHVSGGTAIVFICTDAGSSSLNLTQSLFPQEIKDAHNIDHISFNPCPPTLLKSALKRAHDVTQHKPDVFKALPSDTIDAIVASSTGDIRCAINQFYFSALKGTQQMPTIVTSEAKTGTKRKRTAKSSAIKAMMRDETLGLFHGLGRVLNPKREQRGDSWRIQCDFDRLVDEFSTQPNSIFSFLFENYVRYFADAGDGVKAAEVLSVADVLLGKWKETQEGLGIGLWFVVLGLMVHNEHKVSKWNQIKAPTKISKALNNNTLQTRGLDNTDLYYYNVITTSNSFHTFAQQKN